jgi:ribonuclease P protein component
MNNHFPKSMRLHLRKEIETLFENGKILQETSVRAIYKYVPFDGSPVHIGVSVPKRNFKKAVDRNRIKRQMREVCRLNIHQACELFTSKGVTLNVMFIFTSRKPPEYGVLQSKIILILQRLQEAYERVAGEAADRNNNNL